MKKNIKRITALLTAAVTVMMLVMSSFTSYAVDDPKTERAKAAYIKCIQTNEILFEENPEIELYPTSTVKMMTAIVAIEALSDRLNEKVTVTSKMLSEVSGNRLGLLAGEEVTVADLIHILVTGGNNDGAYCLAYLVADSVTDFVDMMNAKASAIGAFNTHYTNPTGMHNDAMVTTLHDTALIADYARGLSVFMEAASTPKYVMEATNKNDYRNIYNRNCLISKYYSAKYQTDGCKGLNAGSTEQGGACVVTVAEKDGLSYLVIVMGGDSETVPSEGKNEDNIYSYINAITLIDWAFDSFALVDVLFENQLACEIPVTLSTAVDFVTLSPKEKVSVFLPTDVDVDKEIEYSYTTYEESLEAPIKAGDVVGQIMATRNGEVLGKSDLVVTSDVERSDFLYTLSRIERVTKSTGFIAAVISAVIISILVVLFNAYKRKNPKRYW